MCQRLDTIDKIDIAFSGTEIKGMINLFRCALESFFMMLEKIKGDFYSGVQVGEKMLTKKYNYLKYGKMPKSETIDMESTGKKIKSEIKKSGYTNLSTTFFFYVSSKSSN